MDPNRQQHMDADELYSQTQVTKSSIKSRRALKSKRQHARTKSNEVTSYLPKDQQKILIIEGNTQDHQSNWKNSHSDDIMEN